MKRGGIAAMFGIAGLALGWVTRPLVESRAAALILEELISHVRGPLHPLLEPVANQTLIHLALYGLACGVLGFVVAHLARRQRVTTTRQPAKPTTSDVASDQHRQACFVVDTQLARNQRGHP